jgi:hypothetical protein
MTHPTHKTRFSDSSLYDEVCTLCGYTDAGEMLKVPCEKIAPQENLLERNNLAKQYIANALNRFDLNSLWLPIKYAEPDKQYLIKWDDVSGQKCMLGFYSSHNKAWGTLGVGLLDFFIKINDPTHFHELPE